MNLYKSLTIDSKKMILILSFAWEPRLASPLITKASKVKLSIHPLLLFGSKPNSVKKPRSFHGCTAITSFGPNFTGLGTLKSSGLFTAFCS